MSATPGEQQWTISISSSSSAVAVATWWMLIKLLTEACKGRENSSAKCDKSPSRGRVLTASLILIIHNSYLGPTHNTRKHSGKLNLLQSFHTMYLLLNRHHHTSCNALPGIGEWHHSTWGPKLQHKTVKNSQNWTRIQIILKYNWQFIDLIQTSHKN